MTAATEECMCGAKIEIRQAAISELRERLKEWRDGHKHPDPTKAEDAAAMPEHQPQGNNFATTERRSNFLEPDELNQQYRPGPYGRSISLKWKVPADDD